MKRWLLYQAFIGEGIITIGGYDQVIQDSQIQQFAALNKLAGQVGSATVPDFRMKGHKLEMKEFRQEKRLDDRIKDCL